MSKIKINPLAPLPPKSTGIFSVSGNLEIKGTFTPVMEPFRNKRQKTDDLGNPAWFIDGIGTAYEDVQPVNSKPIMEEFDDVRPVMEADGTTPKMHRGMISATVQFAGPDGTANGRSGSFDHNDMPEDLVRKGILWGEAIKAWVKKDQGLI